MRGVGGALNGEKGEVKEPGGFLALPLRAPLSQDGRHWVGRRCRGGASSRRLRVLLRRRGLANLHPGLGTRKLVGGQRRSRGVLFRFG